MDQLRRGQTLVAKGERPLSQFSDPYSMKPEAWSCGSVSEWVLRALSLGKTLAPSQTLRARFLLEVSIYRGPTMRTWSVVEPEVQVMIGYLDRIPGQAALKGQDWKWRNGAKSGSRDSLGKTLVPLTR